MRGRTSYGIPRSSRCARTASKCAWHGSHKMILNGRQRVDDRLIFGHLAIQHAQRIGFRAPLAVVAQLRRDVAQLFLEQRDVLRAAVLIAH